MLEGPCKAFNFDVLLPLNYELEASIDNRVGPSEVSHHKRNEKAVWRLDVWWSGDYLQNS